MMKLIELRKLRNTDYFVKDIFAINLVPRMPVFYRDSRPTSGFNYLLEGEIEFSFDGVAHRYVPGDLIYLPKGSRYTYRSVSSESRRVQLNFSIFEAATGEELIFSRSPMLVLSQQNYRMEQLLLELWTLSKSGGYAAEMHLKAVFMAFLYEVIYNEHIKYVCSSRSNIVLRCIDDIKLNYREQINTDYLCEKYMISASHLRRLFKDKTGNTVTEYINRCRVDSAIKLLVNTDSSVLDIALSVGFDSESYFCRVFKNEVGETPGKYRQMHSLQ